MGEARPITALIRRIRPGEGPAFRSIRTEAIGDSPRAFGSSLAEIEARPDTYWQERARTGAEGNDNVLYVAEDDGRWIGIVGGFIDDDAAGARSVDLISMWVHPAYRREGVGRRLVEQVIAWARERGAVRVVLWVTGGNESATLLYRQTGFRETGATQAHPKYSGLVEHEMVLDLANTETDALRGTDRHGDGPGPMAHDG
jgi:GNAT superfamily N-acetyltransferase